MPTNQVLLPSSISVSDWNDLDARLRIDLRALLAEGGIRYRARKDGRLEVRAEPVGEGALFYLEPLQTRAGALRSNVGRILSNDIPELDLSRSVGPVLLQRDQANELVVDQLGALQATLLTNQDPIPVLKEMLQATPGLRMYRLGVREQLRRRLFFWRVITEMAAGVAIDNLGIGLQRTDNQLVSGLLEYLPAPFIVGPLVARLQPLTAAFMTSGCVQIAVVAPGAFTRPMHMVEWPTGLSSISLAGPGIGAYKTSVKNIPRDLAITYLAALVRGANQLVHRLTDPSAWVSTDELEIDERWIAWMSVRLGLDAIASIGGSWTNRETFWTALRALGILQSLWEGRAPRSVPLTSLLDPRKARQWVIAPLPHTDLQKWAIGVIDNYEHSLLAAFPGDSLDDLLPKFQEVRHLVHGVGTQGGRTRPRSYRLDTLRALADHSPDVQLLIDVAVLWWSAVILDPDRFCRVGFVP